MKKVFLSLILVCLMLAPACEFFSDKEGHIYQDDYVEVGGDGEPIELVNNPNATNPAYDQLVAFIINDDTNRLPYIDGGPDAFVCSDFAEVLHNNAEAAGIKAAWVGVDLYHEETGHAMNAFQTTDRGLVYIDCTGEMKKVWTDSYYMPTEDYSSFELVMDDDIPPSVQLLKYDTIAYVMEGKEYGTIGINEADLLSYYFYINYMQAWEEYEVLLAEYNAEVELYNAEIASKVFIEGSEEYMMIQAWEAELIEKKQILLEMEEELGYYCYYPLGIVEEIHIHW
jgi:hypothetical protein